MAHSLDLADPLAHARGRFRLPDGIVYADGNSLGALPAAAPAHLAHVVESEWGQGLIRSWNDAGWIDAPAQLGARIAPLIGAHADEVIVADSVSVNLFKLLAAGLTPRRRTIVTLAGDFPTDSYIAQGLANLLGNVTLREIPLADIVTALDDQTAILLLTHVHYQSGARHDMAALTAPAHAAGALTLWDLSHSAGAIAVDLNAANADLAVGCGYKFLNGGPGAPAWLFVARRHQKRLENPLSGWMGHARPFAFEPGYTPAPGMARWLAGTMPILALAALNAGLATFDGLAPAAIEAKAAALTTHFIDRVAHIPGITLATPRDPAARGAHVALAHDHAQPLTQALIAHRVIPDFRTPNLIRFGFAPLTSRFADVETAAATLAHLIETQAWTNPAYHQSRKVT
ncbi:kynureninase [Sandaracinobacteroides saxicola]|uniref:Kynureninase n=1 Tax=Sandaracinobacteroides saxicola TaxID=2759707 RepID=A0A7G5IK58_9SPHN|nr:aminotransferase class V-fold PLP-dependent enzyme [Sandaracinobacteroides saxicola]QMW23750.1 aminotransferase class V-fold PLP-dependent enzyme [Sandaracinobacteroides saxicola]